MSLRRVHDLELSLESLQPLTQLSLTLEMKYKSTRDPSTPPQLLTFKEVVMKGLADDGGLFLPAQLPSLPVDFLDSWKDFSFQELCFAIFPLFINAGDSDGDISKGDLQAIVQKSFSGFDHGDITPLTPLSDGLHVLELWHGPTLAFKDIALQFLGNLLSHYLSQPSPTSGSPASLIIVGATSGDTGSASIASLAARPRVSLYMLHPLDRISLIQKAQMITCLDDNVFNIGIRDGTFDDCQGIVKALFGRQAEITGDNVGLGAVNSINWARILAQTIYYFHAYFRAIKLHPDKNVKVKFNVPTGNFGDILAAHYARLLGLPIHGLVIATNSNDILCRFLESGIYQKQGVVETLSPAMDIQISSNFERYMYLLFQELSPNSNDCASKCVVKLMKTLAETGKFSLSDVASHFPHTPDPASALLEKARLDFTAEKCTDVQILKTIQLFGDQMVLDPHTAVGVYAALQQRKKKNEEEEIVIDVCLATAHPIKFIRPVLSALSVTASAEEFEFKLEKQVLSGSLKVKGLEVPKQVVGLLDKPTKLVELDNSVEAVLAFVLETQQKQKEK